MATYSWSVPAGNTITGSTFIKDTDNKIQGTIDDLVDFVNGTGSHAGQGLTYDFVDKASAQTITGIKTFGNGIVSNVTGNVTGTVSGNAGTATKLATARSITLSGDVSGTVNFDGSANVNITSTVADDSHNHIIGNVDGLQTALDGKLATTANAVSASKLATPRSITLSGDVSGTVNFDGSANVGITTTVADDSHNHIIGNVDGLQTALDAKQAVGSYVTTTSAQSLHSTDALRISGSTVYLYKGDGTSENVTIPQDPTIGVGQTWQTFTVGSQRVVGTTYTNSTGKPIMVSVLTGGGGQGSMYLYVDNIMVGLVGIDGSLSNNGGCASAIVPNGSTYKVTNYTPSTWAELR